MVQQSAKTKQRQPLTWQMVLSFVLATLGVIAFTAFVLAHWVEKQILTTDTWTQTVGQLPKNNEVASALSTYTINQLFTATDLQNKIEQALPARAGFLAAPISDQLQSFLTTQTKRVIQSDQFQSIWITANRAVVERLVTGARAPQADTSSQPAQLSVPLTVLKDSISTVLKNQGIVNDTSNAGSGLVVNLKATVGTIEAQIRRIDFLNATLWLAALVAIGGGLVFSRNRRRLILIVGVSIVVISLLQLIGVRALRPPVLNFFADASAYAAAGVVYDTLLASFKTMTIWIMIIALIVSIIAFVLSPKIINKSKTTRKWLVALRASRFWAGWNSVRVFVAKYQWHIVGGALLIGLLSAAFFVTVNWQNVTLILLYIILIAEITSLVATGHTRRAPM